MKYIKEETDKVGSRYVRKNGKKEAASGDREMLSLGHHMYEDVLRVSVVVWDGLI